MPFYPSNAEVGLRPDKCLLALKLTCHTEIQGYTYKNILHLFQGLLPTTILRGKENRGTHDYSNVF